jgi:hypothetical protein
MMPRPTLAEAHLLFFGSGCLAEPIASKKNHAFVSSKFPHFDNLGWYKRENRLREDASQEAIGSYVYSGITIS